MRGRARRLAEPLSVKVPLAWVATQAYYFSLFFFADTVGRDRSPPGTFGLFLNTYLDFFVAQHFLLLALVAAVAAGVWLAALNVRYRDVRYTIPFLIQLWFYVTPIAYPAGLITGPWRVALALNPLTGIVEGCRWALIGTGTLDGLALALSIGISLPVLVAGLYHFRRVERRFADLV